jgi:hypothetical protein
MLRRSISFMIAGSLAITPFWFLAYASAIDWLPHKLVPVAVLTMGTIGIMWLYDELSG